jgi:hypothetical protein
MYPAQGNHQGKFQRGEYKKMGQILIVDDQECVRRLLRAELTLAGYQVLRGASYCLHVEKPSGDIFFEVRSLGCGL